MSTAIADRIEKKILLRAPRARVWRALANAGEFGRWFGVKFMEPERLFAFRWHPFAVERDVDCSSEPTTLVVFSLEEVADGTLLTVTESGFDRIPLARRAQAFTANEQGWTMMVALIEKHLAHAA